MYWPPALGIMAASSPYDNAPITVRSPVTTHTTSSQPGAPTCFEMPPETIKIPEPIIDPATIMVESSKPRPRMNPVCAFGAPEASSAIVFSGLLFLSTEIELFLLSNESELSTVAATLEAGKNRETSGCAHYTDFAQCVQKSGVTKHSIFLVSLVVRSLSVGTQSVPSRGSGWVASILQSEVGGRRPIRYREMVLTAPSL